MLDTVNIEEIKQYQKIISLRGVTSNPSIIKQSGKMNFFERMREIREIIGYNSSLHVQLVATDYDGMLKDAETLLNQIDIDLFIKVPVNEVGLKVMNELREWPCHITATAIYTKFQAYLAIANHVDYVAPYFNRMENLAIDPQETIRQIANIIEQTGSKTKILAASFKNVSQVTTALENGAHAVTINTNIIQQVLEMPVIEKAIQNFLEDWIAVFGDKQTIAALNG